MTYLIIGKIVSILLLPFLAPLALDRGSRTGQNQTWKTRWLKNPYLYLLLLAACAVIVIEIVDKQRNSPSDSETLEFIELSVYTKELNDYITSNNITVDLNKKREILRKFEFASYAWKKADYDEAKKALDALEKGKDEQGPLLHIPSAIISNNLGCVWFKIKRNKQFRASSYYLKAKQLAPPGSTYLDVIVTNINKLDRMVNKVD